MHLVIDWKPDKPCALLVILHSLMIDVVNLDDAMIYV